VHTDLKCKTIATILTFGSIAHIKSQKWIPRIYIVNKKSRSHFLVLAATKAMIITFLFCLRGRTNKISCVTQLTFALEPLSVAVTRLLSMNLWSLSPLFSLLSLWCSFYSSSLFHPSVPWEAIWFILPRPVLVPAWPTTPRGVSPFLCCDHFSTFLLHNSADSCAHWIDCFHLSSTNIFELSTCECTFCVSVPGSITVQ
jgi:hypothetical protein